MNIAVVGSNGFVGTHLVEELSRNPAFNLSLFGRDEQSKINSDFKYYSLPSLNKFDLLHAFKEVDLVYYLASSSIPASTWNDPFHEIENNLLPFLNFLETISLSQVKKISFVSSAGTVYGPSKQKVKEEFDKHPFSPHGIIKFTMENFLDYYRRKNGIAFDIFRVSNVFGEGQNTSKGLGLINTLIENIIRTQSVSIFGDGSNLRNFIYVKDAVKLLQFSVVNDLNASNVFNLGSNYSFTIKEVVEKLKEVVKEEFQIQFLEGRKSDNEFIDVDNSKLLSYFPQFTFTDFNVSLENTYLHLKSQIR